jgi:hypothetical protein
MGVGVYKCGVSHRLSAHARSFWGAMLVSNRIAEEPAASNRSGKTGFPRFWRASGLLLSLAGAACTQSEDVRPPVAQPSLDGAQQGGEALSARSDGAIRHSVLEVAFEQEGETLSVRSEGATLISVLEEVGAKAGFRVSALDSAELNALVTLEMEQAPVHEVVERLLLRFNKVLTFSGGPEAGEARLASVIVLKPKREGQGPESLDGATALLRAIDEDDSDSRQHLVEQLKEPGNEEELARAADALVGSLDARQSSDYFEKVKALEALDRKRATQELEERLKEEAEDEEEARLLAMAARGLGLIGSPTSVPALKEAANSDDPALRVAANESLEIILSDKSLKIRLCGSLAGGCDAISDTGRAP